MVRRHPTGMIRIALTGLLVISFSGAVPAADKKKDTKDAPHVMTQAELQSQVMAFADRYLSIIVAAFNAYEAQTPAPEDYKRLLSVCTYSMSSAFTIAAEPNPVGALLDMVTMVTLGRIIFEDSLLQRYGAQIQPLIDGFSEANRDVWEIAAKVLTYENQQKLKALIVNWRKNNPEVQFFPSIRFSDFSVKRTESEKEEPSGLFKSVENATEQVEEIRLLAERGIFLATRLPMLTGLFAGVWFSQLANHPDMEKILNDLNTFSRVSERLATLAEQLPDKIAAERDTTIKQAMESINDLTIRTIDETARKVSQERKAAIDQLLVGLSKERKDFMDALGTEEPRLKGLLSELRLTLAEGNRLIGSTDSLVTSLDLKPSEAKTAAPAKPFDIKDYQATLKEASNTILQLHDLVKSIDQMGLEKTLPQVVKAVDEVEQRGEKWVFFAFILGVALIAVFLVGAVIASLAYRHLANRIFGSAAQQ